MPGRKTCSGRDNWVSMLFYLYMALYLAVSVSAASFNRRQASMCPLTRLSTLSLLQSHTLANNFTGDFSAENPDDSDASALPTGIASPAPLPTAATEPHGNTTAPSNGTVKASPVSSAAAVATTETSSLNSTNDPNMCHKDLTTDMDGVTSFVNPFCKPFEGQEVYPNISYQGRSQSKLLFRRAALYVLNNTKVANPMSIPPLTWVVALGCASGSCTTGLCNY